MNIKQHIPNAITCCNLLCGCLATVITFEGNLVWAAYLVGLAAVFDFFDGFAARILKVHSVIGKDLDSLADMVTFGVVPGVMMFQLMRLSISNYNDNDVTGFINYLPYTAFMITVFSALRLAKFNNDTRQSDSFIGVPTPANAILIASFALILDESNWPFIHTILSNPHVLVLLSVFLSFLLVSEIPLFSLKFKQFKWQGNEIRYVFLGLSLVLLISLQFAGIPMIIIVYVLMSMVNNVMYPKNQI